MDSMRWPNCLATKISRRHSTGFSLLGLRQRQSYSREIRDVEDLRASIIAAIATVTTTTDMAGTGLLAGYSQGYSGSPSGSALIF
ncbi:hypothetical protein AVEN_168879-1 [Araneus ventricosus]|uniref:Uncharacterized protein n=1 Tax=Araneus ventricosus TaxID=182803 RepID=A0A4Y2LZQ8_ARAVE|nr:hypothetical protein AVEN_168879-1 [Araneus ventricosus]